jgi:hypothetical protein
MISHSHRFVFVHVPKTGGTSVAKTLRPFAEGTNGFTRLANRATSKALAGNLFSQFNQPLPAHSQAIEYRDFLGEVYANYYSFSFVRNPFDWHVSLYEYIRQTPRTPNHQEFQTLSFDEFIERRCGEAPSFQKDFVLSENGEKLVDFVGRFETIDVDFQSITETLGIKVKLQHRNKTRRSEARHYFTEKSQALIVEALDEDFKQFGYSEELPRFSVPNT